MLSNNLLQALSRDIVERKIILCRVIIGRDVSNTPYQAQQCGMNVELVSKKSKPR
jgi:hypothetical protein